MGVDTVKLSYDHRPLDDPFTSGPYVCSRRGSRSPWRHFAHGGWSRGERYGSAGPVVWQEWEHADGTKVVVKGCGKEVRMLWEQSVPKYLGIHGAAPAEAVYTVDRHLRSIIPRLGLPDVRRIDVTADVYDPQREYLTAALNWNPHARSRYTQSVHDDRTTTGHTVWQHNKTRGVRVYDKFHECGEEWAQDLTRVEYQIRGDWVDRYGLSRLHRDFALNAERVLQPLVADLAGRVVASAGGVL